MLCQLMAHQTAAIDGDGGHQTVFPVSRRRFPIVLHKPLVDKQSQLGPTQQSFNTGPPRQRRAPEGVRTIHQIMGLEKEVMIDGVLGIMGQVQTNTIAGAP